MTTAELDTNVIWYSASNEDTRSEIAALRPKGRDLLCITASGSRTFDLLLADPARIVSIDQNPAQTALAELLAAAYRVLDYGAFCNFVGLRAAPGRYATLSALLPMLSADARQFWDRNRTLVDGGLIYCGKWEAYLRLIQRLAGPRRQQLAKALLSTETRAAQLQLWRDKWDNWAWRGFLRLIASRPLWRFVLREPGIAFVPADFDISAYVKDRFDHLARHHQLSEAHFAWSMLRGNYSESVLPRYLTEAGHAIIRERIDRVTFRSISLQDFLGTCEASAFDGASLSDYSSYCDLGVQRGVWSALSRVIRSGGHVCERKFMNKTGGDIPAENGFTRDAALEAQLFEDDQAFFYSFIVAERR
jgi:S-adenosylmethionine-diacylglycerol 3-amino-3-carboxypropyl transferase